MRNAQLARLCLFAFPLAFAGYPLYIFAPDFYTTHHGLSLTLLGSMLLALRLIDGLVDPLIGAYSDKKREKMPLVFVLSSIVLIVSLFALFNPMGIKSIWFFVFMMLATIAASALTINSQALGAFLANEKQTRLTSFREASSLIGVLFAVNLPIIISFFNKETSYSSITLNTFVGIFALILVVSLFLLIPLFKGFTSNKILSTNPLFILKIKRFYSIYALSLFASSMPAVLVIFFVRDVLYSEKLIGVFLLIYFLAGALSMPFWQFAATKWGNFKAWALGMAIASFALLFAFFLKENQVIYYGVVCLVSGFALGADLALPPAIVALYVKKEKSEADMASAFAWLAFISKFALAFASLIAFSLLDLAGFKPNQVNSPLALTFVSALYAAIPSLLKLTAAYFTFQMEDNT